MPGPSYSGIDQAADSDFIPLEALGALANDHLLIAIHKGSLTSWPARGHRSWPFSGSIWLSRHQSNGQLAYFFELSGFIGRKTHQRIHGGELENKRPKSIRLAFLSATIGQQEPCADDPTISGRHSFNGLRHEPPAAALRGAPVLLRHPSPGDRPSKKRTSPSAMKPLVKVSAVASRSLPPLLSLYLNKVDCHFWPPCAQHWSGTLS